MFSKIIDIQKYLEYSTYNNLDMQNFNYDLEDMKANMVSFKEKLNDITLLEKGDKLSFDEQDKLYIDKFHSLQSVKRWYYGMNRENTCTKLASLFEDYNTFLLMVLRSLQSKNNHEYLNIADQVKVFNRDMSKGLLYLKETYANENDYYQPIVDLVNTLKNRFEEFNRRYSNFSYLKTNSRLIKHHL